MVSVPSTCSLSSKADFVAATVHVLSKVSPAIPSWVAGATVFVSSQSTVRS